MVQKFEFKIDFEIKVVWVILYDSYHMMTHYSDWISNYRIINFVLVIFSFKSCYSASTCTTKDFWKISEKCDKLRHLWIYEFYKIRNDLVNSKKWKKYSSPIVNVGFGMVVNRWNGLGRYSSISRRFSRFFAELAKFESEWFRIILLNLLARSITIINIKRWSTLVFH